MTLDFSQEIAGSTSQITPSTPKRTPSRTSKCRATRAFSFLTNRQLPLPVSLRPAILPQNQDHRVNSDDTDILMRFALSSSGLTKRGSARRRSGPIGGAVRFLDCRRNGCLTPHTSFLKPTSAWDNPLCPMDYRCRRRLYRMVPKGLIGTIRYNPPKKSESPRWR